MIILDRNSGKPLYQQIYEHIRQEIIAGELREGRRISATRVQAENLSVSRNTVEQAYMQLCSEGYLKNRPGSGYYVCHVDPSLLDGMEGASRHRDFHREAPEKRRFRYDLKYGDFHIETFPAVQWRKAIDAALAEASRESMTFYGDYCGSWELRSNLADYLERARGVICHPQQIIIGSGTQFLIGILCQLIRPSCCAMEEPGYDRVRHVMENHMISIEPVPVGNAGMDLEILRTKDVQLVYVTPSHQFPMGCVMPIQNRMELLHMAQEKDFYIIEDDYDSIFRYGAKAIPAMQGLDQNARVIYLGSVSKVLSPSLRLSYMVLPPELKNRYDMWFSEYHNTVSAVVQDALQIFMATGAWDRHIRKIRLSCMRKHDALVEILEKGLSPGITLLGKGAGLHLILESEDLTSEEMLVRLQSCGIRAYSMEKYFMCGSSRNLVMLGYGGLPMEDVDPVADGIIEALKIGS